MESKTAGLRLIKTAGFMIPVIYMVLYLIL